MDEIRIEIGQYREVNKGGALKAFFTLVEYPHGRKTRNCQYFVMGENRWWTFPQEKITFKDERKSEYIPYVSYLDKEYNQKLKDAVSLALLNAKPQEKYGHNQNQASQAGKDQVQSESSSDWF